MNTYRKEFADYYWGNVQSIERDAFMQGNTSSTVLHAWNAWCAAISLCTAKKLSA